MKPASPFRLQAHVLTALLAASASFAGEGGPTVVPMPAKPDGPAVRRVSHDATKPLAAGDAFTVSVLAGPGLEVVARLGRGGTPVRCGAGSDAPGTYLCPMAVPPGISGRHHVIAEVTGPGGITTTLTSILPVVVTPLDPIDRVNALNSRLQPVIFDANSAALDEAARAVLQADREILAREPDLPILVEGHCDEGEESPGKLSLERAEAVARQLIASGLPAGRLTTSGVSASVPLVRGSDDPARAVNRRVMILFGVPGEPSAD